MIAQGVLDGPISRGAIETFVGQVLVPTLTPGDVVIMDNLSSHKGPPFGLLPFPWTGG